MLTALTMFGKPGGPESENHVADEVIAGLNERVGMFEKVRQPAIRRDSECAIHQRAVADPTGRCRPPCRIESQSADAPPSHPLRPARRDLYGMWRLIAMPGLPEKIPANR